MLVPNSNAIVNDFETVDDVDLPSKTYHMQLDKLHVKYWIDQLDAIEQAIYKILQTERYDYPKIYSNNYGVEFKDLYGKSKLYVIPEIERRITEALTWDERILSCTDFEFESAKNAVHVTFTANTVFGSLNVETEVAV